MKFFKNKPSRKPTANTSAGAPSFDDEDDYLPPPTRSEPASPANRSPTKQFATTATPTKVSASSASPYLSPPAGNFSTPPPYTADSGSVRSLPTKVRSRTPSAQQQQQEQQQYTASPTSSPRPKKSSSSRHQRPSSSSRNHQLPTAEPNLSSTSLPTSSHSSSSRRRKIDPNIHPLNLPPEERKRLSLLSSMSNRTSADTDCDMPGVVSGAASPSSPNPLQNSHTKKRSQSPMQPVQPAAQSAPSPPPASNGTVPVNINSSNGNVPVPPPHKTPAPTPAEEAEAFKNLGNKYFKDKSYHAAITEYTKGMWYFHLFIVAPPLINDEC